MARTWRHQARLVLDAARQTLQSIIHAQEGSLATRRDGNRPISDRLKIAVARAEAMADEDRKRAAEKAARLAARDPASE
jgi:hypothetical protein